MKLIILIMLHLLKPEPNHTLNKDPRALEQMAGYFVEAGKEFDLDPVLLVVWAFHESSFRPEAKGKLNEKGIFQVHGQAKSYCTKRGLDTLHPLSQIRCGALLISVARRNCASLRRGLWRYSSGHCKGTPRAKRITNHRLKKVERLKRKFK